MKSVSKILMVIIVLLSTVNSFAQIKNTQTVNIKIYGNCEMCKKTIETAANIKGIANVDWNKETKMATLAFDSKKTSTDEILKRIALAGYDSEQFLAPDDVYAKLPECCQYTRTLKPVAKSNDAMVMINEHSNHSAEVPAKESQNVPQLKPVFDAYFAVKDALVKTDGNTAAVKAQELLTAIKAVEMNKLAPTEHTAWMKVMKDLTSEATSISKLKDATQQRQGFSSLSKSVYALIKTTKQDTPVYYQHCPMYDNGKGADWLSKENTIKNPYYGSKMMTCGSTVETLN